WAATGVALAGIGLFPLGRIVVLHNIAALATLALFVAAGVMTTIMIPGPPRALLLTTAGVGVLIAVAVVLSLVFDLFSVTALEAIIIGLALLWLTTLVRIL